MIWVLEPLLTFFLILFSSNLELDSATRGVVLLLLFTVIYSTSTQIYANFTLSLSFLVTRFRELKEVLLLVLLGAAGAFLGSLFLFLLGEGYQHYANGLPLWKVLVIETFASFFIALMYYCMFIDLRNQGQLAASFAVAAMYAGVAVAFPMLSAGNFFKIVSNFSTDADLVFGSIIGQLLGSVFGGMAFKALICDNTARKMKEIDVNTADMKINF